MGISGLLAVTRLREGSPVHLLYMSMENVIFTGLNEADGP
jgi:hypothetical protein